MHVEVSKCDSAGMRACMRYPWREHVCVIDVQISVRT
jgi:hypothetical protein